MTDTASKGGGARNPAKPRSSTRVLIVDDHALVRLGLAQIVASQPDMEVVGEAEGMVDAVRQIQATRADLAIVDLMLQDGNGLELIKMIHAIDASIKVLVLSMYDEMVYAERSLSAGASGYINKEEPPDRVVEAIRAVREGQVYLSPRMTTLIVSRAWGGKSDLPGTPTDELSDRELEVFELIGRAKTTRQVAEILHIGIKTVETHRERIKDKLGLKNGTELIESAIRWMFEQGGMGPPDPRKSSDDSDEDADDDGAEAKVRKSRPTSPPTRGKARRRKSA